MASSSSSSSLFFLLSSLLFFNTCANHDRLLLPVIKDTKTHQYVIQIGLGKPPNHLPTKLTIDLGGQLIWVDYGTGKASPSHRPVPCRSLHCSTAISDHNFTCCSSKMACTTTPANTITRGESVKGELIRDFITLESILGTSVSTEKSDFLITLVPNLLLQGLPSGVTGMAGLGRGRIGLPAQFAGEFDVHRKFSICFSPLGTSNGYVQFGSLNDDRAAKSLVYTPLITNSWAPGEYFIGVKAVKINGKKIQLNGSLLGINEEGVGGTKLSTLVPYTTMETSIYKAFTEAFVEEAASSCFNMRRVGGVGPFEMCFGRNRAVVPVIDLVLQSEMVNWRIYGWNSMVQVSDDVICLGVLDGGVNLGASIVIGGYQLEDNLVEFDLGGSRLGFSPLLAKQTRCSDFNFLHQESRGSS